MAITNPSTATTTDMDSNVDNFEVGAMQTEGASGLKETEYTWTNWTKWYGYYRKTAQLKKAIDALATWSVGKGWDAVDNSVKVVLSHMTGWGEDTFDSIIWNLLVVKKINGDAFAEIIRDKKTGRLLNLKPLDPGSMKVIVNKQGIIERYEQTNKVGNKTSSRKYNPKQILHLVNDRVADEIHGISVVEAVEDVILAREEAVSDWKTVLHRNVVPLTVVEVDMDEQADIDALIKKYEQMIKTKDVLFVPKDNVKINREGLPTNATMNPLPWIEYQSNYFFQAVGVPQIILGGSQEFTEATAKMAYLTFAQVYSREQRELEKDLFEQVGLEITFKKPAEIHNELLSDEAKDKGTMDAAPQDEMAVRTEQE